MEKIRIVVTGGKGQLGSEFFEIANKFPTLMMKSYGSSELNICNTTDLERIFKEDKPQYFINCAAYTAVDLAEDEAERANAINHLAVVEIARLCAQYHCVLIHISTDYVFDGTNMQPYKEFDVCKPMGVYGQTKRDGELAIQNQNSHALIIRTAWVFSSFGKNFVKTMLRLGAERESISVVNDQIGAPTYARHLALAILQVIERGYKPMNVEFYHFTNLGACSWAQFAVAIMQEAKLGCVVNSIPTSMFPTKAKRPTFSVLDTSNFQNRFPFVGRKSWQTALAECLDAMAS